MDTRKLFNMVLMSFSGQVLDDDDRIILDAIAKDLNLFNLLKQHLNFRICYLKDSASQEDGIFIYYDNIPLDYVKMSDANYNLYKDCIKNYLDIHKGENFNG